MKGVGVVDREVKSAFIVFAGRAHGVCSLFVHVYTIE